MRAVWWSMERTRQEASAVNVKVRFSGGEVGVDNINKAKDTWSEVKSKVPFSTGDPAWLDEVRPQAERLLAAAAEHGIAHVRYSFPKGVSTDVAQALEGMGMRVDGRRVRLPEVRR